MITNLKHKKLAQTPYVGGGVLKNNEGLNIVVLSSDLLAVGNVGILGGGPKIRGPFEGGCRGYVGKYKGIWGLGFRLSQN